MLSKLVLKAWILWVFSHNHYRKQRSSLLAVGFSSGTIHGLFRLLQPLVNQWALVFYLGSVPIKKVGGFFFLWCFLPEVFGDGLFIKFLAAPPWWKGVVDLPPTFPPMFPCCLICISFQRRKSLWLIFTCNYLLDNRSHKVELYTEESIRWGKWILHQSCQTYKREVSEVNMTKINTSKAISSINCH